MLNAVLVDDEPMALKRLKEILHKTGLVKVNQTYTTPCKALKNFRKNDPEIVFLDIEMPSMSGLELARELQSIKPGVDVVVVSAHGHYALEAYEAHVSGFLLKPIDLHKADQLLKTLLHRKQGAVKTIGESVAEKRLYVSSFGGFAIHTNMDKPLYLKWRTSKTRELFAFLHHHQGQPVSRDSVLEALWPEMNLEKAERNFYTTCCYLRKMLKEAGLPDAMQRHNGAYRLRMELFESDEKTLMHHLDQERSDALSLKDLEKMIQLYQGEYCGSEDYSWAEGKRAYYEHQMIRVLWKMHDTYQKMKDHGKVFEVLHKMLRIDPYQDAAQKKILEHLKNNGNADSVYRYYSQFHQFY